MKPEFSRQYFEKYWNTKLHEIRPVEAELFHADGQTDMTKLIVAFRSFAPKRGVLVAIPTVVQMSRYKPVTENTLQILLNSCLNTDGCGHFMW